MTSARNLENKKRPEEFEINLRSMMTEDTAAGWQSSDTEAVINVLHEEFRMSPNFKGIRHKSNLKSHPGYDTLYVWIDDRTPLETKPKVTEAQVTSVARELVEERVQYLLRKRNAH